MESPFILSDEKMRILLDAYTAWYQGTESEKHYPVEQAKKAEEIKSNLLNKEYLSETSDEQFIQDILKYSKTLEGPVRIRIGERRVTGKLQQIKRNLSYLIDSPDDPFEKVAKILEGDYKIKVFAKAFWSPIFQAQFSELIPNWNNKTENFLKKVGVDIKTSKLSGKQKCQRLSEAFRYLQSLDPNQNFHTLNHLMHYGTETEEGKNLIESLKNGSGGKKTGYWQIAPGEGAGLWDDLRRNSIAAVGWAKLDRDLKNFTKDQLQNIYKEKYPDSTPIQINIKVSQLWNFLNLSPGDKIITNKGKSLLLAVGTVKAGYQFRPERKEYKHTVDVDYYKVSNEGIPVPENIKGKFGKAIAKLEKEEFAELEELFQPEGESHFTEKTFELLDQLHNNPTRIFYQEHSGEFKEFLEDPFQNLFHQVAALLSHSITQAMETKQGIFSRILKNDYGRGGAWDFYWGAFYTKGGKRIRDPQLFLSINRDRLEFGFYIGEYGTDQRSRFIRNCRKNHKILFDILNETLAGSKVEYGEHDEFVGGIKSINNARVRPSLQEWLKNPEEAGIHAAVFLPKEEVLQDSTEQLSKEISRTYQSLFPLFLVATLDEPMSAIGDYIEVPPKILNTEYPLNELAIDTGFDETNLKRWISAIERKGQVIIYGPPGTGKTYMAEHLAKHLIGGDDGFLDIIQFHPAYAYEDFIQGIRPKAGSDGQLDYPVLPGRFLEFCQKAKGRKGKCVLIIDEMNRANLARVFGELMYLLEYRDREVPLAGGGVFKIPVNVRIIGTMNTADRSIALVDHALRRRFAFLALYPNYEVLKKYHEKTGFNIEPLVKVLNNLNKQINDRHYEVGISFFLKENLSDQIEDIWRMEIEPYLDEYFFDQQDKTEDFRWEKTRKEIIP